MALVNKYSPTKEMFWIVWSISLKELYTTVTKWLSHFRLHLHYVICYKTSSK